VTARLYDFGAISIALRVPVAGVAWSDFVDRLNEVDRQLGQRAAFRRTASLLASRRFAELARRLYTLVAEVTELTERVDNALQVTEDVYLARVYSAAPELFRVRSVSAAVDRKLAIIRDTCTALHDEGSARRAELLELLIVLLIVVEVVLAVIPLVRN